MGDSGSVTTVRAIEIAAQVLLQHNDPTAAATLVAAAEVRRSSLGAPRPIVEQPAIDQLWHVVEAALGASALEKAMARGSVLTVEEIIDHATVALAASRQSRSEIDPDARPAERQSG